MIQKWPSDDTVEWLNPADLELAMHCIEILKNRNNDQRKIQILEIGVWKGGWSFTLCDNVNDVVLVGVDPYPNLSEIKNRVETQAKNYTNFNLFDNWNAISESKFDLIHLDAEHTEKAVSEDLIKCLKHLRPGGILIVDDIRHPYFPGVACSIYNFILKSKLTMLMISEYKTYLCREEDFNDLRQLLLISIKNSELIFENHINEHKPEKIAYLEKPTVRGYPVILCVDESNRWRAIPKNLRDPIGVENKKQSLLKYMLRKIIQF